MLQTAALAPVLALPLQALVHSAPGAFPFPDAPVDAVKCVLLQPVPAKLVPLLLVTRSWSSVLVPPAKSRNRGALHVRTQSFPLLVLVVIPLPTLESFRGLFLRLLFYA